MTRHQVVVCLSALLLAPALLSCGIRGQPQAPLIRVPAVVSDLAAVRLGNEVHIFFRIPDANADGSQPPDVERVDVYAVTTLPEEEGEAEFVVEEWLETAEPLFTFDVVVPEEPEEPAEDAAAGSEAEGAAAEPEQEDAAAEPEPAADAGDAPLGPGDPVTLVEELTPDIVEPLRAEPDGEAESAAGGDVADADADEDVADDAAEDIAEEAAEDAAAGANAEDAAEAAAAGPVISRSVLAGPLVSPPLPRVARRTYIAVAVSRRNQQSVVAANPVPVQPAPDPPGDPVLTYTETTLTLEWQPPATARLPLQASSADEPFADEPAEGELAEGEPAEDEPSADEPADAEPSDDAPAEDDPADDETAEGETAEGEPVEGETGVLPSEAILPPQTPSRYAVYDVSPPAPDAGEADGESDDDDTGIPRPLTAEPLEVPSYPDAAATLGVERCFLVRTVDTVDPVDEMELQSAASDTVCEMLVDTFPPSAPSGLVAVAGGGAISLTWAANLEADLAGYVVLRGRGADGPLEALTPELLQVTNYQDTNVEAGISYRYAVQALDGQEPPNVSPESEPVTEQAP